VIFYEFIEETHGLLKIHSSSIHLRAIILGLLLIPFNNYFVVILQARWFAWPTHANPFSNAVFLLMALVGLNKILRFILPSYALNQTDLLTIYVTVSIGTAIGSYSLLTKLVTVMGHSFWFATPENEWQSIIWPHLPRWLMVDDKSVLRGYYMGDSSLYTPEHLRAWALPALWWSLFAFAMFFVMMCMSVIIRKQWTDRERLIYPITYLPLEMSSTKSRFFSNKLMWIGLAIGASLTLWNGLSFLFPSIPTIPIKRRNIGHLFTDKPWNAIGNLTISFYPFLIGLGFFMPVDLSFSCWFFYLLGKMQLVTGSVTNLNSLPGFPYLSEQSLGAFMALFIFPLWAGRRHFRRVLASLFKKQDDHDDKEGMHYRTAIVGSMVGIIFLAIFSFNMGMSLWVIPVFFALHYLITLVVTRIRAELGFPIHNLANVSPYVMLPALLGTRALGPGSLTANIFLFPFSYGYNGATMPHNLEGLRYAEMTGAPQRRMTAAMLIATVIGIISTFWVLLHLSYQLGADKSYLSWATHRYGGSYSTNMLQRWISYPTEPNFLRMGAVGVGFGISMLFMIMRARFLWWPFHPIGYGLWSGWGLSDIWGAPRGAWLLVAESATGKVLTQHIPYRVLGLRR